MNSLRHDARRIFRLSEHPLPVGTVVDASAGTGKTYAVASHVTLALAKDKDLSIGQILVTTFTRNAAAELRDRVRGRIVGTAAMLRDDAIEPADELDRFLRAGEAGDRVVVATRLERAAAEFDAATIATIHAVCSRVLSCAGIHVDAANREDLRSRIIAEVVNDELVRESVAGRIWSEERMSKLVDAAAKDPFVEPWIEPGLPLETADELHRVANVVDRCVSRVHAAMRSHPGYDDLLRLAWDVVNGTGGDAVVEQLRERFRLAIVDEAQDTDPLQWKFFRRLFPGNDGRRLITVGDPKQAIYGFRGADVKAYVAFARDADRRTLPINRRSDRPLVEALNAVMDGAVFLGDDGDPDGRVEYERVEPDERNDQPRIIGPDPLEFIDVGTTNSQSSLAGPVVRKIVELLDPAHASLRIGDSTRPVKPGDICVIVRTKTVGNQVAKDLARIGIQAVTAGTSSVVQGEMAGDVRDLLEAMDQPSHPGRIRRAAVTRFFGDHSFRDAGTLADDAIRPVQEAVARLATIVRRQGIAACGAAIAAEAEMMRHVTAGADGQRHLADLAHVVELLHEHGPGGGCRPDQLLATLTRLARLDDDHETVVRRIESDDDAVTIMTVHAAKGLEFPCVVVADLWKAERSLTLKGPGLFYDTDGRRVLDVAYALGVESPTAAAEGARLHSEEQKRLLYVAVTRAKHHLCVLTATTDDASVLPDVLRGLDIVPRRHVSELPDIPQRWIGKKDAAPPRQQIAPLPTHGVQQSYERTSFSTITSRWKKQAPAEFADVGRGFDEDEDAPTDDGGGTIGSSSAAFMLPELPAGTAFGSVVHEILERIDTRNPLDEEVRAVVEAIATSSMFEGRHDELADMIVRAMRTPFGGPLGDRCFADFFPEDRLAEMDFEMALAGMAAEVRASDVGQVFASVLPSDDPLHPYASVLSDTSFDIPLAGLINGSIDAVLRMHDGGSGRPALVIADYKTNRLHRADSSRPADAYAPDRLPRAMAEHHYPLQAAIYGTAVYRMLRWRLGEEDPSDCIAGVVYAFLRGTRGPTTPADAEGRRHGMFVWRPPRELWPRLSRLLAGERP